MLQPNSPIFTPMQLTPLEQDCDTSSSNQRFLPQLPSKPTIASSSLQIYIIPAETRLFVAGFDAHEHQNRPPTILRGLLYIRVLKPQRIKSINLNFRGIIRTEWPEGIPPKRNTFSESNDEISHTWPFYLLLQTPQMPHNGADTFVHLHSSHTHHTHDDVSHLSLGDPGWRSTSPPPMGRLHSNVPGTIRNKGSPAPELRSRSASLAPPVESGSHFLSRALSPGQFIRRSNSPDHSSFSDLTLISSSGDHDTAKLGHFPAGDYVYNFEHPIQLSCHESCHFTFGQVSYYLEASVARHGTFKSNLNARIPIDLVRIPSEESMEESEPIVVTRDWEDQLRYDIVIGAKSVVLQSYLPIAFRFVPLMGKLQLHRIRVYVTENMEYYSMNRKVHRMEPAKKYLLLEHKAAKGCSLLAQDGGVDGQPPQDNDEVLPRELEFQVYVPETINKNHHQVLHPDTSFDFLQAHHWLKICFRVSRFDPENPAKRKHYEISIDSPLRILSQLASHDNTLLPAYDESLETNAHPESNGGSPIPSSPVLGGSSLALAHHFADNNNHLHHSASLDEMLDAPSPQPPQLPVARNNTEEEFRHLNFASGTVLDRDADMHLEANVFKPNPEDAPTPHSTQAQPHPQNFTSLLNSPLQRPIHLIRRPSTNPPAFDATVDPLYSIELAPPPSYEEPDPQYSESPSSTPHRNDASVPSPETSLLLLRPSAVLASETPSPSISESGQAHDVAGQEPSAPTPSSPGQISPESDQGTVAPNHGSSCQIPVLERSEQVPPESQTSSEIDLSLVIPASDSLSTSDLQASSELIDADACENANGHLLDFPNPQVKLDRELPLRSKPYNTHEFPDNSISEDMASLALPESPLHLPHGPSRNGGASPSSITSTSPAFDAEQALELRVPLLRLSLESSLETEPQNWQPESVSSNHNSQARNSSVSSLVYELFPSQITPLNSTKMTTLMGDEFDLAPGVNTHSAFHRLRNPRIKHADNYSVARRQVSQSILSHSSHSSTVSESPRRPNNDRKKSFGVHSIGIDNLGRGYEVSSVPVDDSQSTISTFNTASLD